jgi:hypothetical protein
MGRSRHSSRRPCVEPLEDRYVLSLLMTPITVPEAPAAPALVSTVTELVTTEAAAATPAAAGNILAPTVESVPTLPAVAEIAPTSEVTTPSLPVAGSVQLAADLSASIGGSQLVTAQANVDTATANTNLTLTTQVGVGGSQLLGTATNVGLSSPPTVPSGPTAPIGEALPNSLIVAPPSSGAGQAPILVNSLPGGTGEARINGPTATTISAPPLPASAGTNALPTSAVAAIGAGEPGTPVVLPGEEAEGSPVVGLLGDLRTDAGDLLVAAEVVPGPAEVSIEVTPRAGQPLPAPESADVLAGSDLVELADLDALFQQTLEGLAGFVQGLQNLLTRLGPWPWLCLGIAAAAAACELVRRRQEQVLLLLAMTAGEIQPSWMPDLE